MPAVTAVLGDITTQAVDAVVSSANNAMRVSGGVNGAIHRRGGPTILRECVLRFPNGLALGEAGWTTAGDLPARVVIHTVGPNYSAGQRDPSLLAACYRRVLEVADEIDSRSVAFPLLGAGRHGWPRADAIAVAIETLATARPRVAEVRLVASNDAVYRQIRASLLLRFPPTVGADTVGALFEREPTQYSLRGDAYLWRNLRARFADTPLPGDWIELRTLVTGAIEEVVGERFDNRESASWHDPRAVVYVPEFDPGHGMSAGAVHVPWWVHTGVPILLDRYEGRTGSDASVRDQRGKPMSSNSEW